ncbi:hypothetical protein HK405_013865, partial [Cladochytrium tenue]
KSDAKMVARGARPGRQGVGGAVKGGGAGQRGDEFDAMWALMTRVDEKILLVETDLTSILESDAMSKYLPQSRRLFEDVRKEYGRIEQMYGALARKGRIAAVEPPAN